MQMDIVKDKGEYLIHSELDIKKKKQEDKTELLVFASTSYEVCPYYDMKIETDEPIVKMECEDQDEIIKDPLDVYSEIKVADESDEEHLVSSKSKDEIKCKILKFGEEEEKCYLTSDEKPQSYENQISNNAKQLSERNKYERNKKHTCQICHKSLLQNDNLNVHLCIHTDKRPFICHFCKKIFNRKTVLDQHLLIHSGEKPHACDVCQKVFRLKMTLNKHKLIHNKAKQFSCSVCYKSFRLKHALVRHEKIHTGDKPHTCDLCNKTFTQTTSLIRHKHLHTGEKPFSCDICYKSFADKIYLNRHTKKHKH